MRIGIVGGVERGFTLYQRLASEAGHEVEFHGGHLRGRGIESLASLVRRADLVVIITEINSHGAVRVARKLARAYGRRQLLLRSFGIARFCQLLERCAPEANAAPRVAAAS